jgi:oligoendopeptidase F
LPPPARAWIFFEGELINIPQKDLLTKLSSPELAKYGPWLGKLMEGVSTENSERLNEISADFYAANTLAWHRLYREMLDAQRVEFKGQRLTLDEADALIGADEGVSAQDKKALRQLSADTMKALGKKTALIYNTIIQDSRIDGRLSGYTRPDQAVNVENGIAPEMLDTMKKTLKEYYTEQSQRFYTWIAAQDGKTAVETAALEIPEKPAATKKGQSFEEARKLILRAFNKFSPKFARIAKKFFDEKRIDALPRPGKESGAFSQPVGPGELPFIMVNYTGDLRDMIVLGHELGHGVHQKLSEDACGFFMSEVSTPIAETASVFAEMLVFDEILKREKDPAAKKRLLAEKVENMLSNSLQQLSYYEFECRVHKEREAGEVPFEKISDIWMETQKEYFGPSVVMDDYNRYGWMTVPHFFETPFYVYSYAFAQVLVSSLYQAYKEAEAKGSEAREEFVESYTELLQTGMTRTLHDMFWPFGLDLESPDFWRSGMSLTDKYMKELVALDNAAPSAAVKKPPAAPKAP